MSVMCSVAKEKDVVTFELVAGRNGDPIYKIACYNGEKWMSASYRDFDAAYATWKLVSQMV